ncbi:MAG: ATP-dependent helicase, partial [Eubacteriales bacterium]|nr:ATP-dependent helicase [Eubacteriales bacterium]
ILYRTNAQSRLLEEKCVSRNVPYVIVGGMNFYQRKEIKDMLAYLRVISNGQDDISCMRILNVPKRGIGQTTSDRTAEYARSKDIGFFAALKKSGDFLTGAAAKKTLAFTGMIESFRKRFFSGELDIRELIEAVAEETGYEEELRKEDPISAETRMENIGELVNKAADFEANYYEREKTYDVSTGTGQDSNASGANTGISRVAFEVNANAGFDDPISIRPEDMLAVFLEEISLISELDRTDPEEDVITMMTLHSAKGLEFDRVYLCGMEDGLFPSMAAIGSNNPNLEIEEERRLCYVGFTRAKKELFLSSAASRMINGDFRSQIGSRFIEEIPDEMAEKHYRRNRSGRYADSRDSFAGFGGYEGSLEYSSRSREEMYGFSGNRFQDSAYRREESSFRDRAYDGGYGSSGRAQYGYGSSSSQGGYGSYTGGRYGSLDTAPAGRRNSGRSALSQISIPGLKKGFGESDPVKKKPEYEVGDRVEHVKFGTGIVLSIEEDKKDYKVTVNFDKAGVKAMYA